MLKFLLMNCFKPETDLSTIKTKNIILSFKKILSLFNQKRNLSEQSHWYVTCPTILSLIS